MNLFRRNGHFLLVCILLLCTLCLARPADADEQNLNSTVNIKQQPTSLCPIAQMHHSQNKPIYFLQHAFEDGAQDLAIIVPATAEALEFKRVTFRGSAVPECHYKALALARGGDWGWHLSWVAAVSTVLSYARMDGEAWVSSPVKKLSKNARPVTPPVILTWQQQVWIVWQEAGENESNLYAVFSADEGRSWQNARLITKISGNRAAGKLDSLQLIVKQNKPYLTWADLIRGDLTLDGAADAVPLPSW